MQGIKEWEHIGFIYFFYKGENVVEIKGNT